MLAPQGAGVTFARMMVILTNEEARAVVLALLPAEAHLDEVTMIQATSAAIGIVAGLQKLGYRVERPAGEKRFDA